MDILDSSTGTILTPSYHGRECLGNGLWVGYECCCDECDYLPTCWPESVPLEDAVLRELMQEFAAEEGRRAIDENERLKVDPDFVVPEETHKKMLDLLGG